MSYRIVPLCLLLALCPALLAAQEASPRGTEFWLAFMQRIGAISDPGDPQNQVRLEVVAGDRAADVRAEIPGSGWSAVVSLAPGGAGAIVVPAALAIATGSERVENRGVYVTATAPVTLSAISHVAGSADATIVLPVAALGREYLVATYDPYIVSPTLRGLAEFVVVAPSNGITVEITPSAATDAGRPAGVPFVVGLQRGQSYQVQSEGNLSGTRVRTVGGSPCDRFALFAGNVMAEIECVSVDHLYEQMLPIAALGRSYAVAPFAGRRGDLLDVIAADDGTLVTDPAGGASRTLDAGERMRLSVAAPMLIEASKPVAVVQYARGKDCDSVGTLEGDPMMVQLRPLGRAAGVAFVAPGTLSFTRHYLTLVARAADTPTVRLDGLPVGGFTMLPGSATHAWAQLEVDAGAHLLGGPGIEGVTLYGEGSATSYGMDLGGTPDLSPRGADVAIRRRCACEGVVLEAPEGFASYRWPNGDTTRSIVADTSGSYTVTVDNGGCRLTSDSIAVVVPARRAPVRLYPAETTVNPGDIVPFTLVVAGRAPAGDCSPAIERIALRFRATMLAPDVIAGGRIVGDSLDGADRIVTIELRRDTVLLDMVAALGDTTAATVTLELLGADTCRTTGDTLARLTVTGCEVGGRRLFLAGAAAAIKPVRPDPVSGEATVELRTLELGATRLELVDALGRTIGTLLDATLEPGEHTARLDASGLPAGPYLLVLLTPSGQVVRRVMIR